ncbi:SDR family NAD(P)-dependent oxidoreductase [Rhodopirellula halodulae]|uniref:SDR family NAD(P)-dependent oxidoreductase n=1 Tax=Rhodopirellula halodulae TaxID=2894198 RepID=UPI001E57D7A6|nr:SDR family NAD(P)-dependent oxidoreductase [Rhodopirellula sp. JC737]MCC9657650.1 SDR family NAD(P)-dependent oxidoreductase [Rhodopirellula sp. JC737]
MPLPFQQVWSPEDSVAIVTGASSGIGWELTRLLVAERSHVIVVARRRERLLELAETSGHPDRVHLVVGDVTQAGTRDEAMSLADELGNGGLDLLVNNAGVGAIGPFAKASAERMRKVMEVNFFAPVEWTRAALPRLRCVAERGKRSVVCNIGSVLGHRAVPDKSEYCASKFALHGWNDSLRAELIHDGIGVTLVSPSTTQSEFFDALVDTDPNQKSKSIGSWPPSRVAAATLDAIKRGRSEVILSLGGKALVYADRVSPPVMNGILAKRGD